MMWLAVASGGALGCLARYGLAEWVYSWAGKQFPFGILAANVLGCLIIGFVAVWLVQQHANEWLRGMVIIGFLGGFTTFSSFSLDTIRLMQEGAIGRAMLYIGVSLVVCLAATTLGAWLGNLVR